ncbi:MAG: PrsW family glutamic-type intramembrane protease [Polyangiaceae bacterium]
MIAIVAVPLTAFVVVVSRWDHARYKRRLILLTAGAGVLAFVPMRIAMTLAERWAGLLPFGQGGGLAAFIYAFLVAAPLAQGLKVGAMAPMVMKRKVEAPIDGIVYAGAAAMGFVSAQNAVFLWSHDPVSIDALRAVLSVPAHLFFAAAWGYALGREGGKNIAGTRFNLAWLAAAVFNGVYDHIVLTQPPAALLAAVPILATIGVLATYAARDLLRRGEKARGARRRILPPIPPPSLRNMREALKRAERPVVLSWIAFGALVTVGVMIAALAGAVALGHQLGVDFAAVDRSDGGTEAAGPLVLLGGAALFAFPVAAWLVARASRARSVMEVALSAVIAILGTLILLGLAAPVSLVFAIAFAPVAFGLACVGAWLGLAK